MLWRREQLLRHWAFLSLLIVLTAIFGYQLDHGLGSDDGHGIVWVVRRLVEDHAIVLSRPPGHPTTEFYLFGCIGYIITYASGISFNPTIYLLLQMTAALGALTVFYELLGHLGISVGRATLATACLALTPQFFLHAVDGEEFVIALLFVLIAVRLLLVAASAPLGRGRLALSIFSYALATGCRPEMVFAGLIYPLVFMLHPGLGRRDFAFSVPIYPLALLVVWLPVLCSTGLQHPYDAGMDLRASLLAGGYKLIFQGLGLPTFLLVGGIFVAALSRLPRSMRLQYPRNFVAAAACLLPLVFFTLFFCYPTKAGYVLVTFPFLVLLALERANFVLHILAGCTLLSFLVGVDFMKERRLSRPYVTSGSFFQAVNVKPFYRLGYIQRLMAQCDARPTVVIGNLWPRDYTYHVARGTLVARVESLPYDSQYNGNAVMPRNDDSCVLLSFEAAHRTKLLEDYKSKGYTIKMDRSLYRSRFARYDVLSDSVTSVVVDGLEFTLF